MSKRLEKIDAIIKKRGYVVHMPGLCNLEVYALVNMLGGHAQEIPGPLLLPRRDGLVNCKAHIVTVLRDGTVIDISHPKRRVYKDMDDYQNHSGIIR